MTRDGYIKLSKRGLRGVLIGAAIVGTAWFIAARQPVVEPVAAEAPVFLGVPDDFKVKADEAFAAYPVPFQAAVPGIADQDNAAKNVRLWEASSQAFNPGPQQTGDCVSWGITNALTATQRVKALKSGVPPPAFQPFAPYAYGTTRVQIGQGYPPCGSLGADPSMAIKALRQLGWVYTDEASHLGFQYDGRLADNWGCKGAPKSLMEIGKARSGADAYPIRSVEEWRDAIVNGYGVTVAFYFRKNLTSYQADGRWVVRIRSGNPLGNHQISSIGYDGSAGKPYWFVMNSHGSSWPGSSVRHTSGEPAGGCWVGEDDARWIVNNGVLWAISSVPGFEADELDLSIFDELRMSRAQAPRK